MLKRLGTLLSTLLFVISGLILSAQEAETGMVLPSDIPDAGIIDADSVSFIGSDDLKRIAGIDTLTTDTPATPDENLNELFSEKMDSLINSWYVDHFFQSGSTAEEDTESYPTNLPDSVYIARLQEIQQVIDLSYNNVVRNFIELYTEKRRDLVEAMLGLSAYYFPLFEETLDRYQMPLELKYLPVIESALNPKAMSRAGANGLWQFMYGTGKQMGLDITSFVDERRDPDRSTDAAVRYLQTLYRTYNDWFLAIAAYNCGPGNVNRAIQRSGNKTNYWEIYYRLPRETRGYVPAFIAVTYVMNFYKEHNLHPRLPQLPLKTDTIKIQKYLHFNQLEATLNLEKELLRTLNPMYRRDVIPAKPEKPYPLVLPIEKITAFIDQDTTIFAYEREKYFPNNTLVNPVNESASYFNPDDVKGKAKIVYTVKSGDNIGFISSWFHVRSNDLKYWNNIHRNLIRAGQKLAVYVPEDQKERFEKINGMTFEQKQASIGKSSAPAKPSRQESIADPNFEYYTVKNGDTLWDIAKKHAGISAEEILRLNNLPNGARLSIGQKLKIKPKNNT